MEDKTIEKATELLGEGIKQAKVYCYEVLKSVSSIAPLQGHDLERAFIAGFQAGQLSPLTKDEVEQLVKSTSERLTGVLHDLMSDA
jgi:hypothetical protein